MEIKRINDYKKKIADVEALRENQRQKHLDKVKQIDEKYENTRIAMYSQIKEISNLILPLFYNFSLKILKLKTVLNF